jgi:hypothetical protein
VELSFRVSHLSTLTRSLAATSSFSSYTDIYTYTHVRDKLQSTLSFSSYEIIHIYADKYTFAYTYTHTHKHAHTHIRL